MFFYENDTLICTSFIFLKHLDDQKIEIQFKSFCLSISGHNLYISNYAKSDLVIKGSILKLEIVYESV